MSPWALWRSLIRPIWLPRPLFAHRQFAGQARGAATMAPGSRRRRLSRINGIPSSPRATSMQRAAEQTIEERRFVTDLARAIESGKIGATREVLGADRAATIAQCLQSVVLTITSVGPEHPESGCGIEGAACSI